VPCLFSNTQQNKQKALAIILHQHTSAAVFSYSNTEWSRFLDVTGRPNKKRRHRTRQRWWRPEKSSCLKLDHHRIPSYKWQQLFLSKWVTHIRKGVVGTQLVVTCENILWAAVKTKLPSFTNTEKHLGWRSSTCAVRRKRSAPWYVSYHSVPLQQKYSYLRRRRTKVTECLMHKTWLLWGIQESASQE